MSEEILPGARVPAIGLTGEQTSDYIEKMRRILRAARLNTFYPESRRLAAHLEPLDPDVHLGLYDEVQVDVRTGLPTYREWTRVQTDVTIARDQLRQLGSRAELQSKATEKPDSVWARQLKKHDYYTAIQGTQLAPLGDMDTALRRLDRQRRDAAFHVVLDKLDASGVFVRYTIDVAQSGARFADGAFRVDEREVAEQSEDFEGLIYKFTSLDAEFTFVKLATFGTLLPENVRKGTVGPIWFEFTRTPDELRPIVADGGFVASFALDAAAIDIAEQKNNDPFASLAEDRLTVESRSAYVEAKERFGYKVYKDRKFVVPRDRVDAMREICDAHGTKNIIYGI